MHILFLSCLKASEFIEKKIHFKLTKTEREVLKLLGSGLTRQEAADRQLEFEDEFNTLTEEQKLSFNEKELENLKKQLLTEGKVKKQFIQAELKAKIKRRNQFIKDEIKFGKTIATINRALNSAELTQISNFAKSVANLSKSKNKTLQDIAKAAAIVQITIDTAKGSVSAFTGMASTFPGPVGLILGGIAAAAVVATKSIL